MGIMMGITPLICIVLMVSYNEEFSPNSRTHFEKINEQKNNFQRALYSAIHLVVSTLKRVLGFQLTVIKLKPYYCNQDYNCYSEHTFAYKRRHKRLV